MGERNTKHPNTVEFQITGDYALFADPIMRVGGEKCSYQIPTYEALKGILSSVYWKPTFIWYIDKVRIMKQIKTETKGIRLLKWDKHEPDLAYYTYLKDCCYQVQAHFEWNENREELQEDRVEDKHHNIAIKMLKRGGRRDIFLGTRECQGYVEPCKFGEGEGQYDNLEELTFGLMLHGFTYADEAYNEETKGKMTARFWRPSMRRGIVKFPRPECFPDQENGLYNKFVREMKIKRFNNGSKNFSGIKEFKGE